MIQVIDFAALTPQAIADACTAAMQQCDAAIAAIVAIPDTDRTFGNTVEAMELATEPISRASGMYTFMSHVSSDDALREAGRTWDEALDRYAVALAFREDLYAAVAAYAARPEANQLPPDEARLLAFALRDYRRSGFGLRREEREAIRELFDRLVALGLAFRHAIDDWDDAILVPEERSAGLPEAFLAGLTKVAENGRSSYRVSLDYPELHPFLANSDFEDLRRELFTKDQRKGGNENVARLEEAIRIRTEIARRLGYRSWADYVIEERMARTPEAVGTFLTGLRSRLEAKAATDFAVLRELKRDHTGSDDLQIWDWRYYHNRLLRTRYAVNDFAVAEYFPLDAVLEGLFRITQSVLGVEYRPVPDAPVWHPDVQAFDIYEADDTSPFARFYMDLFPRPNTYGHAAAFTIVRGHRRSDGTYQSPVSAIVANFTKPTPERPSLLRHNEVEVLFHEFGHILHQTLTRARFSRFSGTATERDFVEAPSQMLEHWVWDADVLRTFARHFRTGEPIPQAMVESLVAAQHADSGIIYLRQLYFAMLDLELHAERFDGDSIATVAALHPITGFPYTAETWFHAGFGHLFGYDAGYYGYLWSKVLGDDMYTRWEEAGPLSPDAGERYRKLILERGGSVDGDVLAREFLGRQPDPAAFFRALGLDSPAS